MDAQTEAAIAVLIVFLAGVSVGAYVTYWLTGDRRCRMGWHDWYRISFMDRNGFSRRMCRRCGKRGVSR